MPETTTPATSKTSRSRISASSSPSDGGAKIVAAILAVLAGILAFALFKANNGAGSRAEIDAATMNSLSNQVTELRTKLALEHSDLEFARSNHLASLQRRTAELMMTSNRLVQTTLLLDHARVETHIAQSEAITHAAALATAVAQRDEWERQASVVPAMRSEVADLRERLQHAQFIRASIEEALGQARTAKADLERKLEDPSFLRVQARHAEDAAEVRRRVAANERVRVTDSHARLSLQPDGTVSLSPRLETDSPSGL